MLESQIKFFKNIALMAFIHSCMYSSNKYLLSTNYLNGEKNSLMKNESPN